MTKKNLKLKPKAKTNIQKANDTYTEFVSQRPAVPGCESTDISEALHSTINTQVNLRDTEYYLWETIKAATRMMYSAPNDKALAESIRGLVRVREALTRVSLQITPISKKLAVKFAKATVKARRPITYVEVREEVKTA